MNDLERDTPQPLRGGSPRERFFAFFDGKPVEPLLNWPLLMTFIARRAGIPYSRYVTDYAAMVEAQISVANEFGIDVLTVCSDPVAELADMGAHIVWFEDEPPQSDPKNPLLRRREDLECLESPDPARAGSRMNNRLETIRLYREVAGDRFPVLGWVEGPMAQGCNMREISTFMEDLIDAPKFVHELFDWIVRMELSFAEAQIDAGADMIGIGDAAASLVGPDLYEEFVWPYQKRLVDEIRKQVPVRLHICGNTTHLASGIARLGVDLVDIDSPSDLAEMRKQIPASTAILGNIDPVRDVLNGTPDWIHTRLSDCHSIVEPRFVVGAGCEIPAMTPEANLKALKGYATGSLTSNR